MTSAQLKKAINTNFRNDRKSVKNPVFKKDGSISFRSSYIYRGGRTAEKFAASKLEQLSQMFPEVKWTLLEAVDHYNNWPNDSHFEAIFSVEFLGGTGTADQKTDDGKDADCSDGCILGQRETDTQTDYIPTTNITGETTMASAPYQMWSIDALKNEAIKRGADKGKVVKLTKDQLVSALTKQDEAKKEAKPKTAAPAAKPKTAAPAAKAKPKTAAPAAKPKTAAPKAQPKEKKEKEPAGPSSKEINKQLKAKGLWASGMQFISKDHRLSLLNGDDKDKKKVMKHLETVMSGVRASLSTKMSEVMQQRIKDGLPVGRQAQPKAAAEAKPKTAAPAAKPAPKPAPAKAAAKPAPKPAPAKAAAKPASKPATKPTATDDDDLFG